MTKLNTQLNDPLHEILERHLFRGSTDGESSNEMVGAIIADYLMYLDSQGVHIPGPQKEAFIQDLKEEIREQALKKTHGALNINLNESQINLTIPKANRNFT